MQGVPSPLGHALMSAACAAAAHATSVLVGATSRGDAASERRAAAEAAALLLLTRQVQLNMQSRLVFPAIPQPPTPGAAGASGGSALAGCAWTSVGDPDSVIRVAVAAGVLRLPAAGPPVPEDAAALRSACLVRIQQALLRGRPGDAALARAGLQRLGWAPPTQLLRTLAAGTTRREIRDAALAAVLESGDRAGEAGANDDSAFAVAVAVMSRLEAAYPSRRWAVAYAAAQRAGAAPLQAGLAQGDAAEAWQGALRADVDTLGGAGAREVDACFAPSWADAHLAELEAGDAGEASRAGAQRYLCCTLRWLILAGPGEGGTPQGGEAVAAADACWADALGCMVRCRLPALPHARTRPPGAPLTADRCRSRAGGGAVGRA